ncbi:hypothetical protein VC273_17840 [Xanthomonas nasturtii]|uniref:hypothetical protein n=1 Tax=Xanthomonas TaxID=338 RepID=UPI002B23C2B1|nr:hypothetical protein [Xanthomonas nasturtii]MEA9557686.1 hypothetical protein [Xanthomonas nasturtii]
MSWLLMAPLSRKHRGFDVQRLTAGIERTQADPLAFECGVEEPFTTPSWRSLDEVFCRYGPHLAQKFCGTLPAINWSRSISIAKWLDLAFNHELNNNLTLLAGARK